MLLNPPAAFDPPEFQVFHARGNEQNVFDRVPSAIGFSTPYQLPTPVLQPTLRVPIASTSVLPQKLSQQRVLRWPFLSAE